MRWLFDGILSAQYEVLRDGVGVSDVVLDLSDRVLNIDRGPGLERIVKLLLTCSVLPVDKLSHLLRHELTDAVHVLPQLDLL